MVQIHIYVYVYIIYEYMISSLCIRIIYVNTYIFSTCVVKIIAI